MDKANKTILVTGATGTQGCAAVRRLLQDGWRVRAFVRDLNKVSSRLGSSAMLEAATGDLGDRDSVQRAVGGCYGVFGVLTPAGNGVETEVKQGKLLADLAKEAGVKHFVYSSVASANQKTGIPHFETKGQIEQYIQTLKLPATVVRPVWFMDNFETFYRGAIDEGRLCMALGPDRMLQMIAVEDIARVACECFNNPKEFIGSSLDLAGDELSLRRATQLMSQALGRTVAYSRQPIEELQAQDKDFASMFRFFEEKGYNVNISGLRSRFPFLMTFEQWLDFAGWRKVPAEALAGTAI